MSRWLSVSSSVVVVLAALTGSAAADERKIVPTSPSLFTPHPADAKISPYLYLNRCSGGCSITGGGNNDARSNMSSIPTAGSYTVTEFANQFGQLGTNGTCLAPDGSQTTTLCTNDAACTSLGTGALCDTADYEWNLVVKCMKEVYSPYMVNIVDSRPTGGLSYTMAVIAGVHSDIGEPNGVLGIAPLSNDCSPQDNVISFSFANDHQRNQRVYNICWTAAQETAHAFGLDHQFSFPGGSVGGPMLPQGGEGAAGDGLSACNDPMTYSVLCGGEKFFRNETSNCGEYETRPCRCGGTQNSHAKLLDVFGAGQSIVAAPTAALQIPANGATVANNWNTVALAGSQRGVANVELWLNGYKWNQKIGAAFGQVGQPVPSQYSLVAPNGIPDGKIKIIVKAFDDLGLEGDATATVTKGAACTDESKCLTGQKCNTGPDTDTVASGGCYWDPPTGSVGDACTYQQFCLSGICQGPENGTICTQHCVVGIDDSCPSGFECSTVSDGTSLCFPGAKDGGGCCSASAGGSVWVHGGFAGFVLVVLLRRRPRRK